MTPTAKLRFVERKKLIQTETQYTAETWQIVRILQQWWEPEYNIIDMVVDKKAGEWRDVPIEKE